MGYGRTTIARTANTCHSVFLSELVKVGGPFFMALAVYATVVTARYDKGLEAES
jgi:hypothetical protein